MGRSKDFVLGDKIYVVRSFTLSKGKGKKGTMPPRVKHPPIYETYGPCEVIGEVDVGGETQYKLHNRARLFKANEMYRFRAACEKAARVKQVGG